MKKIGKGMVLVLLLLATFESHHMENLGMQSAIAGKVIRFHVLANSDSQVDQKLKLKVRDDINQMLKGKLESMKSVKQARKFLGENLEKIEQVAQKRIRQEGFSYDVMAKLCTSHFPDRTYEGHTFPEGDYEALKVVIGKGEGHNWWCVMYPNLCFSNTIYKWNQKEWTKLKKTLSNSEYYQILDSKKITIRLKFLEYFRKKG